MQPNIQSVSVLAVVKKIGILLINSKNPILVSGSFIILTAPSYVTLIESPTNCAVSITDFDPKYACLGGDKAEVSRVGVMIFIGDPNIHFINVTHDSHLVYKDECNTQKGLSMSCSLRSTLHLINCNYNYLKIDCLSESTVEMTDCKFNSMLIKRDITSSVRTNREYQRMSGVNPFTVPCAFKNKPIIPEKDIGFYYSIHVEYNHPDKYSVAVTPFVPENIKQKLNVTQSWRYINNQLLGECMDGWINGVSSEADIRTASSIMSMSWICTSPASYTSSRYNLLHDHIIDCDASVITRSDLAPIMTQSKLLVCRDCTEGSHKVNPETNCVYQELLNKKAELIHIAISNITRLGYSIPNLGAGMNLVPMDITKISTVRRLSDGGVNGETQITSLKTESIPRGFTSIITTKRQAGEIHDKMVIEDIGYIQKKTILSTQNCCKCGTDRGSLFKTLCNHLYVCGSCKVSLMRQVEEKKSTFICSICVSHNTKGRITQSNFVRGHDIASIEQTHDVNRTV